jgi:hypothetical protein
MRGKGISAYLALSAACLVLLASMGVLVARAVQTRGQSSLEVGELAPGFELSDGQGHRASLQGLRGRVVVLFFAGSRCPVSARFAAPAQRLEQTRFGGEVPVLMRIDVDEQQAVAARYAVETTPTFLVIDRTGHLRYSGAFEYVQDAVRRVCNGLPVAISSTQAFGTAVRRPN